MRRVVLGIGAALLALPLGAPPLGAANTTFILQYNKDATYEHLEKSPIAKAWVENMITPGFQNFQVCTYLVYTPGSELSRTKAATKTTVKSKVEIVSADDGTTLDRLRIKKFKVSTSAKSTSGIRCKTTEGLPSASFLLFLVDFTLTGNRDLNGEFRLGVLAQPFGSSAAARESGISPAEDLAALEERAREQVRRLARQRD